VTPAAGVTTANAATLAPPTDVDAIVVVSVLHPASVASTRTAIMRPKTRPDVRIRVLHQPRPWWVPLGRLAPAGHERGCSPEVAAVDSTLTPLLGHLHLPPPEHTRRRRYPLLGELSVVPAMRVHRRLEASTHADERARAGRHGQHREPWLEQCCGCARRCAPEDGGSQVRVADASA